MNVFEIGDLAVLLGVDGEKYYKKASYPVRYGTYDEIRNGPYSFQFNLNGEIRHIQCRNSSIMEPTEWLKRTTGNDWVFYSSGGYNGAFTAVGEYYVPCFPYRSNGIMGGKPFSRGVLEPALESLASTAEYIESIPVHKQPRELGQFCSRMLSFTEKKLKSRAEIFHSLTGGRISVLPPDTRHVDYDVIPINISEGCLYNCTFCTVKSGRPFKLMPHEMIEDSINAISDFYGPDIKNYNSIFLGQHDALNAGENTIIHTAEKAFDIFNFSSSLMKEPRLFLFGSAGSFLKAEDSLFENINRLPFHTYINIGLESSDEKTLEIIGKPVSVKEISQAFTRMENINRACDKIEVTANFLYGENLPDTHMPSCLTLIQKQYKKPYTKGTLYFSPYGKTRDRKTLVTGFKIIKNQCNLSAFLYIIQRL